MTNLKSSTTKIRLTQTVQKGGCAAKVAAAELRKILAQVNLPATPPELIVGSSTFDDAAIYRITSELALVQTLDFFTPIVDSPRWFGRIAAANALSDVYAMGGQPKTAMAILAFPLAILDTDIAVEVLQGASDVVDEAKAALVGGHTIDDDTLKFGLSVTGFVHPDHVWTNAGAQPGDALILTKPLGTGTLTAALKFGEVNEADIQDGMESMGMLNNVPDILSTELRRSVHAATDVTGFGLAGHAYNLARASQVQLEIESVKVPRFVRALDLLEQDFLTKAHRTNREYVEAHTHYDIAPGALRELLVDPQTNGGLLLTVKANDAAAVLTAVRKRFPNAQQIGRVGNKFESGGRVSFV